MSEIRSFHLFIYWQHFPSLESCTVFSVCFPGNWGKGACVTAFCVSLRILAFFGGVGGGVYRWSFNSSSHYNNWTIIWTVVIWTFAACQGQALFCTWSRRTTPAATHRRTSLAFFPTLGVFKKNTKTQRFLSSFCIMVLNWMTNLVTRK